MFFKAYLKINCFTVKKKILLLKKNTILWSQFLKINLNLQEVHYLIVNQFPLINSDNKKKKIIKLC